MSNSDERPDRLDSVSGKELIEAMNDIPILLVDGRLILYATCSYSLGVKHVMTDKISYYSGK
jgi:hypothetical protein